MIASQKTIQTPLQAHGIWMPGVIMMRNLVFNSIWK